MTNIEELEDEDLDEGQNNETDYETKLAELEAAKEKAENDAKKWKDRFKSTAKKVNEVKPLQDTDIESLVDRKVAERDFFTKNESASQYESEIKEIQKNTGLPLEDAYRLHIARTNPELLTKKKPSTGIDGYSGDVKPDENDPETLLAMNEDEFYNKYMKPSR